MLFVDSADKAARFIQTCNAFNVPLLFLADVPGFMIGTAVERQGIIRHGAKMISAVSEATVPKISVIVRKAYGAGLYAMAGPAFEPDCCIALPGASIAVMGPEAAINAVFYNQIQAIEDEAEREEFVAAKREEYAADIDILHLASELVVDAVIEPDELRAELIRRFALRRGQGPPLRRAAQPGHAGLSSRGPLALALLASALAATMLAPAAAGTLGTATWSPRTPVPDPQDVAGPRADGRFVIVAGTAAGGERELSLYDAASGRLKSFARGANGYSTSTAEPYIVLARHGFEGPRGCSFGRDATYALEAGADPGIVRISRTGVASRFAGFAGFPVGIAFDRGGAFGHRLLVAVQGTGVPSVIYAFDCQGERRTVVRDGPRIEGGITVAPRTFGAFGRDLIGVDEVAGRIYAFAPGGETRTVADSGIASGGDIGVEAVGFVPGLRGGAAALVADAGRDAILGLSKRALDHAAVRGGDLLVAAEGPPTETITVRCDAACTVRSVALGPAGTGHAEGHIKFVRGR